MKIKKRLEISNILMLVIPVIFIVFIASIMKIPISNAMETKIKEFEEKDNRAYYIQDRLRIDMRNIKTMDDVKNLADQIQNFLEPRGYKLVITYDREIIYSNLKEEDQKIVSNLGDEILFQSRSLVLEMNSTSLVKNSFKDRGKIINIIAVNSSYIPNRIDVGLEMRDFANKLVIEYIAIAIIISIIIIFLTNLILSSIVYKKLISPLEILSNGAEQIKDGNLDFKINYNEDDEFGKVCSDFDEMRKRLKGSIEAQIKYEEDRKQMVAGISHDLRTPLTVIKGYAEGIRDGVANTEEKKEKYLNIIYKKACDMDSLVDSLFLFSKLDTGYFPFEFVQINIIDYIKKFYSLVKDEFYSNGLEIKLYDSSIHNAIVNIDIKEMDRVLLNVLENSVKYKKEVIGKAEIKLFEDNKYVIIDIKDNGIGVKKEELDNLFISFYRCDPSRSNSSKGSGLGLAIAKEIVKGHNGEILAYSDNDDGLGIKIKLPK